MNQQKSGKNNGSLGKILRRLNLNSAAERRTVRGKEAVVENQVNEEEGKDRNKRVDREQKRAGNEEEDVRDQNGDDGNNFRRNPAAKRRN